MLLLACSHILLLFFLHTWKITLATVMQNSTVSEGCVRLGILHSQVSWASSCVFLLLLLLPPHQISVKPFWMKVDYEFRRKSAWFYIDEVIPQIWTSRCRIVEAFQQYSLLFWQQLQRFHSGYTLTFFKYSQVGDRNVVWIWQACRIRLRAVIWHGLFILKHLNRIFSQK